MLAAVDVMFRVNSCALLLAEILGCGDTENEAIDEAINWVASVVLEGEDGM